MTKENGTEPHGHRLIVLADGETWCTDGYVIEVTQAAFDEICDGRDPCDVEDAEVIWTMDRLEEKSDD